MVRGTHTHSRYRKETEPNSVLSVSGTHNAVLWSTAQAPSEHKQHLFLIEILLSHGEEELSLAIAA